MDRRRSELGVISREPYLSIRRCPETKLGHDALPWPPRSGANHEFTTTHSLSRCQGNHSTVIQVLVALITLDAGQSCRGGRPALALSQPAMSFHVLPLALTRLSQRLTTDRELSMSMITRVQVHLNLFVLLLLFSSSMSSM